MNNRVRVKIYDDRKEVIKFLYRKKINIYNIEYTEKVNIYTIDLNRIEDLDMLDIEIVSYRGIKSLIFLLKRNIHFIGSIILSIIIMVLLANMVFSVRVIHSNKNIRELLEDELFDSGIKPFIFKKSFKSIQKIKEEIKKKHPDELEWLEIIDDGMRYTVRVEERIITKPDTPKDFCNVVSTKDAVILNINPSRGQAVVGQNEYVKKGTILISGEIKFDNATKSHVCANGIVYGNTWYKVTASIPFEHTTKTYTKKKTYNIGFEYGSTYNRIFKIHFNEYDIEKKRLLKVGRFALYKERVREYESEKKTYTEEEALDLAKKQAREKLNIKLDEKASIINEKVLQTDTYDSIINVDIFYSVKEPIGRVQESIYTEPENTDELEEIKELE